LLKEFEEFARNQREFRVANRLEDWYELLPGSVTFLGSCLFGVIRRPFRRSLVDKTGGYDVLFARVF